MRKKTKILLASTLAVLACTGVGVGVHCALNVDNPPVEDDIPVDPGVTPPDDGGEEQPLAYSMTFKIDEEMLTSVSVANGGLITPPDSPKKEGYIFQGWVLQGTTDIVDFSTLIATENMTFVAVFEEITYRVTFSVDGEETTQQVSYQGYAVAPTAPSKEGYIFTGWAIEGTTEVVDLATTIITEDTTFVAIWIDEPIKVTSATQFTFDGAKLTGYTGTDAEIVIPSTYSLDDEGKPIDGEDIAVTVIGSSAFANNLIIQKVIIQDGIIELMGSAFDGCKNLTEVSLPNTLNVMSFSIFSHTGLKSITIPASVESVNGYIFDNCTSLESVVLNEGLKSIPQSMFYCCSNLKNISIPESVTSIGNSAFVNCYKFTGIFIPKNVTSIGNSAFEGCKNVTSIIVDEENAVYNSNNNCNAIIETSTNTLIRGCNNTTIPDDIKAIGDYAFSQCEKISSITIPDSVISIGLSAFNACEGITTIIVGSGVTSIGDWCFNKNSGEVFKVIFRSPTPATIQDYTFGGNHWSAEIYAPDEAVDAYKEAWADCASQIKPVSEYVA